MRVCQQCGQTTNDDSLDFCQYCGTQYGENNYEQPSYEQYQQPQYSQPYPQNYGQQNYARPAGYGQQNYNQPYPQYMGYPGQSYGAYIMASQNMGTGKSKGVGMSVVGLIITILGCAAMISFEEFNSASTRMIAYLADELIEFHNICLLMIIAGYALTVIGIILCIVGVSRCRGKGKTPGIIGLIIAVVSLAACIYDSVMFAGWVNDNKDAFTMLFIR